MKRPECEDELSPTILADVSFYCQRPQGHKGPHKKHEIRDEKSWTIRWKRVIQK